MVKGSFLTPFLLGSKSNDAKEDLPPSLNTVNRMSTSTRFPSLRRLDTSSSDSSSRPTSLPNKLKTDADTPANPTEGSSGSSLLHLKFSGPSFLDVVAKDRETKEPKYIIETVRETTTVYRLDRRFMEAIRIGAVQWPQSIVKGRTSGRTVQIGNGRWRDTEEFLKYGTLANFANRRFNIPHWPHPLKWKLVPGNSYVCTTQDVKGPIAILDAAVLSAPPRLRIYHNFMTNDAERSQRGENVKGVPVLLLDHLMVTALILLTEVQEWLDRPQSIDGRVRIPGSSHLAVQKWLAIIHGDPVPASPGPGQSSPTGTTASNWDADSNRHSSGTASLSSGPMTPSTPASSAHGHNSLPLARDEEIPPVPPLPDTVRTLPHTGAPQTYASFDNLPSLMSPLASSSTSSTSFSAPSSKRGKRPLPTPPVQNPSALSAPRPWTSQGDGPTSSPLATSFERERPSSAASSTSSNSRRSRVGRSLTIANIPSLQLPPSQTLPLPPKLAQELGGRPGPYGESSAAASTPMLLTMNPDPLPPDEEARLRQSMRALAVSSPPPPPPPPPPLIPPPIPPYSSMFNADHPIRDAGQIGMADASRRRSYADTVYEQPPPAYDAIDFSLPQVRLPHRQ